MNTDLTKLLETVIEVNESETNEAEGIKIVSKEGIAKELYNKSFAELTDEEKAKVNQTWKDRLLGRKPKTNEAEVVPQTMKPQEKPDIDAKDFRMEDYSEEDLEKAKSKSAETGDAIRQVKDDELKIEPTESKHREKKQKSLWLCTECCKTFESKEGYCEICKSDKHVEIIIEDASGLVGFTKHVYQVDYKTKDGQEESTRVMAFDHDDAEHMILKDPDVDKVLKVELIKEGKNWPGKRDGTGPYKHSYQRIKHGKGKRKQAGKKCLAKESKLEETVEELIGEVPGVDIEDQQVLRWALKKDIIPVRFPSYEEMIDGLSVAKEKGLIEEEPEDLDLGEIDAVYLRYVLLPKAKEAAVKAGLKFESKEDKVDEELTAKQIEDMKAPKLVFKYDTVQPHKKMMEDLATTNFFKSAMVGTQITLINVADIPVKYAKDEDLKWKPYTSFGFVEESELHEAEDNYVTVGKGLEKEDAEKLAVEKEGVVIPDEENKDKFSVVVKKT